MREHTFSKNNDVHG